MRRSLVVLIAALFTLVTASVCLGAPTKVIDQQNYGPVTGTNGGSHFGQSFIPTLPGIDYVEVMIGDFGSSLTVQILDGMVLFDGLGGPIIGTSNPTYVDTVHPPTGTGQHQMIHFDFPTTVSVTPGNTYVFRLSPGGSVGRMIRIAVDNT
jgi:hypothetical protein